MSSNKNNNNKFFLGLTVAVLLPLSFYIIAKVLGKDKLNMPRYYNAVSVSGKDTIYHRIGDAGFVNQFGDAISLNKDLSGKILVVEVFFSHCETICPQLTSNMTILQKAFKRNDSTVQLLSVSIDPARDSVPALKAYAERFQANPDHWWFLTGQSDSIYRFLHDDLKLMLKAPEGAEQLDHTPTLVLIDKERYVRGYYNGLDTADLRKCADDIGLLSMQKKVKAK